MGSLEGLCFLRIQLGIQLEIVCIVCVAEKTRRGSELWASSVGEVPLVCDGFLRRAGWCFKL